MKRLSLFALLLLLAAQASANVVLYTDRRHPPIDDDLNVKVIFLDAPDTVQALIFGELPAPPDDAERQAKTVRQSPTWQQQQRQITDAWQGVLKAWQLGIQKIPAVVFDDKDVVYGTTDIRQASELRARSRP